MKVEHALRDLYDHEKDLRLLILLEFVFIAVTFVVLALDEISIAVFSLLVVGLFFSLAQATLEDGKHRKVWQYLTGGLNGVALEKKREALEDYTFTDETDLEDLEP